MTNPQHYDKICMRCNGLIARPNTGYGYSGNFCQCEEPVISQNVSTISINHPQLPPKGEDNWSAKLTEKDILEMREERIIKGKSFSYLAKKYGVHPGTISKICLGKKWKHIPFSKEQLAITERKA